MGQQAAIKTLLLTDLVGSTDLFERLGDAQAAEVSGRHDRLARTLIERHGGREIDKSDGFLLLFERPIDAVRWALDYHAALATLGEELGLEIAARCGIHLGEVIVHAHSPAEIERGAKPIEVEGLAKPTAARIMSLAEGGQTLVSATAFQLARRAVVGSELDTGEVGWQSHGLFSFQGVPEPQEVHEVGRRGSAPFRRPAGGVKASRVGVDTATEPKNAWRRALLVPLGLILTLAALFAVGRFGMGEDSSTPGSASDSHERSIAVLPFADMSEAGDQEYFSEGISEELLNLLTKIPELRVVGRSSSFRFKGARPDSRVIGSELGVAFLIDGSVRRAGDQLRVTAELVSTLDGVRRWSQRFDRPVGDIFVIQDEIAQAVVTQLEGELFGTELFGRRTPTSAEAHDLYLLGKHLASQVSPAEMERAVLRLHESLELDPNHAPTWVALASVHTNQTLLGVVPPDTGKELTRQAFERAIELDPGLAEAHAQRGWSQALSDWDWEEAERTFDRALQIDPRSVTAISQAAVVDLALGRHDRAIERLERAVPLDPLRVGLHANLGFAHFCAERPDLALAALGRAIELSPEIGISRFYLSLSLSQLNRPEAAQEALERVENQAWKLAAVAIARGAASDEVGMASALAKLDAEHGESSPFVVSQAYAAAGNLDRTFERLDLAVEQRDPLVAWVKGCSVIGEVRGDPRFESILEAMGLASGSGYGR